MNTCVRCACLFFSLLFIIAVLVFTCIEVRGKSFDFCFLFFFSIATFGSLSSEQELQWRCKFFLFRLLFVRSFFSSSERALCSLIFEFVSSLAVIGAGHSLDMTNIEIICCHSVHNMTKEDKKNRPVITANGQKQQNHLPF